MRLFVYQQNEHTTKVIILMKQEERIRINQIKLPVSHTREDLDLAVARCCKMRDIPEYRIVKQSLDARDKSHLRYIYSVELIVSSDLRKRQSQLLQSKNIVMASNHPYRFETMTEQYRQSRFDSETCRLSGEERPVVVGTGPAGLFCGYMLAKAGYHPLLIERGSQVEDRVNKITAYFDTGVLDESCNVQFGEGGAGTFSDGKLNTSTHDRYGRIPEMLKIFVQYGADPEILYHNKPHIGTDQLRMVVKNLRQAIIELGGEVLFDTSLTDLAYEPLPDHSMDSDHKHELRSITIIQNGIKRRLPCRCLILALGHSARDTFYMLEERQVSMQAKPFAIGLRIEHPAEMINRSQYGISEDARSLGAADYKLTYQTTFGRSVYSFCMCPGGHVIDASSERGLIAVNGMSYHARDAMNSNSAIVVNITPDDCYQHTGILTPLAGVEYQRIWERLAYQCGTGAVPIQMLADFNENRASVGFGEIEPDLKGRYHLANLRECLPNFVSSAIIEGIMEFDRRIAGFGREDAVLCGVESRTSSPVRILRGEDMQSNIRGIFPCGEGAGYAGGITSAAVDGIKIAEAVAAQYRLE